MGAFLNASGVGLMHNNLCAHFLKLFVCHAVVYMAMSIQHPTNIFSRVPTLLDVGNGPLDLGVIGRIDDSHTRGTAINHVGEVVETILPNQVNIGCDLHRNDS